MNTLKKKDWTGWKLSIISITTCGLMVAATLIAYGNKAPTNPSLDPETAASIEHAGSLSKAFRHASETILPSVVLIQTFPDSSAPAITSTPDNGQIPPELENHPFFKRFFEDMPSQPHRSPRRSAGMGSGVIIDTDGLILTNHHVVKGGGRVVVRLHDGQEFDAVDVRHDPKTDLAIVRIEGAGDLKAAAIGNSDQTEIGDWVLAVGAPFGLKETVTAGIISAKSRGIGITDREEFLQTDAAINPGNSGGPLVNLRGQIVGINTAISSTSGGYQGIGFAIPINLAQWVGDSLVQNGHVQRAFLGVGIQPLSSSLSNQLGLGTVNGALVTDVRPDSPASKAGLKSGDVIVRFDDRTVDSPRTLQSLVERASLKDAHALSIVRDGKDMTIDVNVAVLPNAAKSASSDRSTAEPAKSEFFGMTFQDLSEELAGKLGLDSTDGILVSSVSSGSPADKAGLSAPFIVKRIGSTSVSSVEDAKKAMAAVAEDSSVLLLVQINGGSRFVVLKK